MTPWWVPTSVLGLVVVLIVAAKMVRPWLDARREQRGPRVRVVLPGSQGRHHGIPVQRTADHDVLPGAHRRLRR